MVALADECAGSDGDIVTAAIGSRLARWSARGPGAASSATTTAHELVDGTRITVPRLAFWFDGVGWGVENYGVDPDVEVIPTPDDWAAGRDVQLETAVGLALAALRERPAVRPPDPASRPSRRRAAAAAPRPGKAPAVQLVWDMDGTLLDSAVARAGGLRGRRARAWRPAGHPGAGRRALLGSATPEMILADLLGQELAVGAA